MSETDQPNVSETDQQTTAVAFEEQHQTPAARRPPPPRGRATRLLSTGFHAIVPTNEDAMHFTHNVHGEQSWQANVLHFLHKRSVQFTLMGLLLLDVMVLFLDLFLLAEYPNCSIIERDAISCCAAGEEESDLPQERNRFLSGASSGEEVEICLPPSEVGSYPAGCNPEKWPHVHAAEEAFFIITITILSVFLLENVVQIVVLTPQVYFRQLFFVLDFFIISVSIALEVTFQVHDEEALQSLAGLLVLGRIWRFVRISHGLIEVTSELSSQKYHTLMEYTEELEDVLRKQNIPIPHNERVLRYREASISYQIAQRGQAGVNKTVETAAATSDSDQNKSVSS